MKQIVKIVLTGGPCAGKTTGMSWIVNNFTKQGWKVFVVAETATELITGNAKPWEVGSVDFQAALFAMEKAKERSYEEIASSAGFEKALIVCDRGALDSEAYISKENLPEWHQRTGLSSTEMMADYDAVFHLVTAAKGAEEYYTTENNSARTETAAEAAVLDDKLIEAWTGHPHLRVIDNSTGFEKKMQRLVKEIASFLGEPEPFEIERKFLIQMPDRIYLELLPACQRVEILQTYLKCGKDDEEVRVRQRGDGSTFLFTKTTKKNISGIRRIETERRLTIGQYCTDLMQIDPECMPIRKTRYCLTHGNTYFEIDLYPFWNDRAILEVELADEDEVFRIPEFIHVIREVTDLPEYKNYAMAKNLARFPEK